MCVRRFRKRRWQRCRSTRRCRSWRCAFPSVGELSRKEREENHPLFDQKKGAKFIDDFKRLAKSFPDTVTKIRELAGAAEGDFLIVVAGDPAHHIKASDTKFEGRLSEREINVYSAAGNFRSELAKKYADRHKAFEITDEAVRNAEPRSGGKMLDGAAAFHPDLDRRLSDV